MVELVCKVLYQIKAGDNHQNIVNSVMDCSHVTKFIPIFKFLISARYSVKHCVNDNGLNNG